jgi:UDP-N-acetylmuramate: L-alanyl-gamma-D-glutamyl-meso-diaminopimelate ligase
MNGDDDNFRALEPMGWTRVVRVGTGEKNDLRIVDFKESPTGAGFGLLWKGMPWTTVAWGQPGIYNARNAAMAACAAGLALASDVGRGLPPTAGDVGHKARPTDDPTILNLEGLARFRGVKRRQELLVDSPKLKIIEDFGHHPTALAATLQSFRARFPGHVVHAAFEPRSNTSRTKVMQAGFMRALALADEVYLGAVANAHKMKPEERFDVDAVIQFLETQGVHGHSAETNAALLEKILANTKAAGAQSQLVVFFTNGSFDGIIGKFVAAANS